MGTSQNEIPNNQKLYDKVLDIITHQEIKPMMTCLWHILWANLNGSKEKKNKVKF